MLTKLTVQNHTTLQDLQKFAQQTEGKDAKIYGKKTDGIITLYLKPRSESSNLGAIKEKFAKLLDTLSGKAAFRRETAKEGIQQIMERFNTGVKKGLENNMVQGVESHVDAKNSLTKLLDGLKAQSGYNMRAGDFDDNRSATSGRVTDVIEALLSIQQSAKLLNPEQRQKLTVSNNLKPQEELFAAKYVDSRVEQLTQKHELSEVAVQITGDKDIMVSEINKIKSKALPITIDGESYKPHSLLGSGGFGHVYLYKNEGGTKSVAVKVTIDGKDLIETQKSIREGLREVEIHIKASEQVPNSVLELTGVTKMGDGLGIIMEIAPHGDVSKLGEKVREEVKEGRLDPTLAKTILLTMIRDMVSGLQELHAGKGLTHYDFKSPNVLIDSKGHGKIADFGTTFEGETILYSNTIEIGNTAFKDPQVSIMQGIVGKAEKRFNHESGFIPNDLKITLNKAFPEVSQDHLEVFRDNILIERQEVLKHEIEGDGLMFDTKMTDLKKADIWGLGASIYELFKGEVILSGLSKKQDELENGLRAFGNTGGDAIAPSNHTGNVYDSWLGSSTGDPEVDKLVNSILKPNANARPDAQTILKNDIFIREGLGSRAIREKICELMSEKKEAKPTEEKASVKENI